MHQRVEHIEVDGGARSSPVTVDLRGTTRVRWRLPAWAAVDLVIVGVPQHIGVRDESKPGTADRTRAQVRSLKRCGQGRGNGIAAGKPDLRPVADEGSRRAVHAATAVRINGVHKAITGQRQIAEVVLTPNCRLPAAIVPSPDRVAPLLMAWYDQRPAAETATLDVVGTRRLRPAPSPLCRASHLINEVFHHHHTTRLRITRAPHEEEPSIGCDIVVAT